MPAVDKEVHDTSLFRNVMAQCSNWQVKVTREWPKVATGEAQIGY